jgi:hypothetical protein
VRSSYLGFGREVTLPFFNRGINGQTVAFQAVYSIRAKLFPTRGALNMSIADPHGGRGHAW